MKQADLATGTQAAAVREHPAHHPVLAAPCTRSWLQRQHRLKGNIASGTFSRQQLEQEDARGLVSPDCRLVAHFTIVRRLEVRDLRTDALLLRRLPPDVEGGFISPAGLAWDSKGQRLLLPYTVRSPVHHDDGGSLALSFMAAQARSSASDQVVRLPSQAGLEHGAWAEAGGDLVLVRHLDEERRETLSVFDFHAVLQHSIATPWPGLVTPVWFSSAGSAVALRAFAAGKLFIWDFAAAEVRQVDDVDASYPAWATPDSHALFVGGVNLSECALASVSGPSCHVEVPAQQPCFELRCAVWGCRLAVLACSSEALASNWAACDQLLLLSVSQGLLALEHTLSVSPRAFCISVQQIKVSPDGAHCACVTEEPGLTTPHLALVHLASGSLQDYAVAPLCRVSSLQWSSDCLSLLVLGRDESGQRCNLLYSFAEE